MVKIVSLVTWLPGVALYILVYNYNTDYLEMPSEWNFHVAAAFAVLTTANSLVNPIMYAISMAEFRKIVSTFPYVEFNFRLDSNIGVIKEAFEKQLRIKINDNNLK